MTSSAACHAFGGGITPKLAALALHAPIARRGNTLAINGEGLPVFAYAAWKSDDIFDNPTEDGIVAMPQQPLLEAVIASQAGVATPEGTRNEMADPPSRKCPSTS